MLGQEIRKARKAAGLSQEELAFRAKVSRNYVSLVELDQTSPTVKNFVQLCKVMGVRASTLLARTEKH